MSTTKFNPIAALAGYQPGQPKRHVREQYAHRLIEIHADEHDKMHAELVRLREINKELLAALQACLTQLKIVLPKHGLVHDEYHTIAKANAAIAKATPAAQPAGPWKSPL